MTITQMQYIVAVDKFGSFVTAADECNVTQPTLSMQIQKLEDEFGFKIFDRNHHPVTTTVIGKSIIDQLKNVLFEVEKVHELLNEKKDGVKGSLKIAVLPTLAPYILPKMLKTFLNLYPNVEVEIYEYTTGQICSMIKEEKLDFGIMATPLHDKDLKEVPIFYEQFVAYLGKEHALLSKKQLLPTDLKLEELWTLNDEHCMHFQAINLCTSGKGARVDLQLQYQTGSIQSLTKMVESNGGVTLLPELCLEDMYEGQLENMRYFKAPEPVREISLVHSRYFVKNKIAQTFIKMIAEQMPKKSLALSKTKKIIQIK
jgi:LysR family transcriptional regulator, hydrogen peroxide-inducible genes activator